MSNCVTCESRTYRHLGVRKTISWWIVIYFPRCPDSIWRHQGKICRRRKRYRQPRCRDWKAKATRRGYSGAVTDLSRKLHDIHRNWPIVYRRFRRSLSLKCSCFASVGLTAVLETTIFFSVYRTAHSWCMLIALRDKLIALGKFCKKYVTMESVLNVRKTKVFLQRTT